MTPSLTRNLLALTAALTLLPLAACSSLSGDLPDEAPPLGDMEEPLALFHEPDDEAERTALPLGGYTGVIVSEAPLRLGSLDEGPAAVRIARIVENSPADAAGLAEGDLLLAAWEDEGDVRTLSYASEWREVELAADGGTTLHVRFDRAGREFETSIDVLPRVHGAARRETERFREEDRVGVVLRTATEVEARTRGLGPGGGAIIVGLSARSPWRRAGLRYGDLIVEVEGEAVAHPQVVLDAIRKADDDDELELAVARGERVRELDAPLSNREQEVREVSLWPLLTFERDRGESELSILLGAFQRTTTAVAAESRLLWIWTISSGDSDRLESAD